MNNGLVRKAFIIQGNTETEFLLNTGLNTGWKTYHNKAFHPLKVGRKMVNGFFAAGPTDSLRADHYPWGWKEKDFNDSDWKNAGSIGYNGHGIPHGYHRLSGNSVWKPVRRNIPFMEKQIERFPEVERSDILISENWTEGQEAKVYQVQ